MSNSERVLPEPKTQRVQVLVPVPLYWEFEDARKAAGLKQSAAGVVLFKAGMKTLKKKAIVKK